MSFSEYDYLVRGDYSALAAQDRPVDTGIARAIANNAQHLHDQHAQVLVNMSSSVSGDISTGVLSGVWGRWFHLGPFPVHMRPSSGAYRFRVRAAIGHNPGFGVDFRIGVGPGDSLIAAANSTTLPSNMFAGTATTPFGTWTTATDSILTVPAELEPLLYESTPTVNASGAATTTRVAQVYVDVFAKAVFGTQTIFLDGLYVAEYVGTP